MYFIAIWVSYLLFILLAIFVFAASFHSWSVEKKKKAKTQEGSLRNSVNFCTIPVALSFCKMCCLTYASLVVFVLYHDIDRAVYAPVTLPSFFFFFFLEWVCNAVLAYLLFFLAVCSGATSFSVWKFNLRTGVYISMPVLVGVSVRGTELVPPNDWNTLCCYSMPLVVVFCFFTADNELYIEDFIDFFWLHKV